MTRIAESLRAEHADLLPQIDAILEVADAIGELPGPELVDAVTDVHRFLTEHLIPHATAEDRVLYPMVAHLMGSPRSTATMQRDHAEISTLTEELGLWLAATGRVPIDTAIERSLRRVLYGLYSLVKLHLAKEEDIYLPLLEEKMHPDDQHVLYEAMARAAAEARGT